MPKNKGKGGKNRRRGKNENEGLKRELVFKEDGQEYAQVSPLNFKRSFVYLDRYMHFEIILCKIIIIGHQDAWQWKTGSYVF